MALELSGQLLKVEPSKGSFADRQTGELINYDNLFLHILDAEAPQVYKVKVPLESRHEVGAGEVGKTVRVQIRPTVARGEFVPVYLARVGTNGEAPQK